MPRIVRCSLIQATNAVSPELPLETVKRAMVDKHVEYIGRRRKPASQIVCLQEIFYGPYFCAEQEIRWYDFTEPIPGGPTIRLMQDLARKHKVALIVPIYEIEQEGIYYNTAAVIDANGDYLGKYRKNHIPHVAPGFWEKFYFRPGNLGYPAFDLGLARIGVYICYDRHFPGRRARAGHEWGGDRVQSVGDGSRAERSSMEIGTAGPRGRQRILYRGDQPRWCGGSVEHR